MNRDSEQRRRNRLGASKLGVRGAEAERSNSSNDPLKQMMGQGSAYCCTMCVVFKLIKRTVGEACVQINEEGCSGKGSRSVHRQ